MSPQKSTEETAVIFEFKIDHFWKNLIVVQITTKQNILHDLRQKELRKIKQGTIEDDSIYEPFVIPEKMFYEETKKNGGSYLWLTQLSQLRKFRCVSQRYYNSYVSGQANLHGFDGKGYIDPTRALRLGKQHLVVRFDNGFFYGPDGEKVFRAFGFSQHKLDKRTWFRNLVKGMGTLPHIRELKETKDIYTGFQLLSFIFIPRNQEEFLELAAASLLWNDPRNIEEIIRKKILKDLDMGDDTQNSCGTCSK